MYRIEHFYYGQLVHHGKPTGETRVLARTEGVTDDHVAAALRYALVPALADAPKGTVAIVRGGRGMPFIMAQAQVGSIGQTTLHYHLIPSDVWRSVAGNLSALKPLIKQQLPTYDRIGDLLIPETLPDIMEPSTDEQVDTLLDLMTYTGNNTRNIEPLLSVVVQGDTLVVKNAPADVDQRIGFVQGLMTLLPASTRFGVTFATHVDANSDLAAQIMFMNDEPTADTVVYDWQTHETSGDVEAHDYSRFIISQLRLDAELVAQQTGELTPVAGWRYRSGDSLADALAYASHRSKIDKAVLNNMPVEVSDASRVLSEDPTLDDDLRVAYAQHLMSFSLALEDMQYAEPVAVTLHNNPQLAEGVHQQLQTAVRDGKGGLVLETLSRWLANPLSPQGPEWRALLHQAVLAQADVVAADEDDDEALVELINQVQSLDPDVVDARTVRRLIEKLLPKLNAELSPPLLNLAMAHMARENLQRLLTQARFVQTLPRAVKRFLAVLSGKEANPPDTLLIEAAEAIDKDNPGLPLMRLTELAYSAVRDDLVNTPTLAGLVAFAVTDESEPYRGTLAEIAQAVNTRHLDKLTDPGPRYVLQLMLASGHYNALATAMTEQSRQLYGADHQFDYVRVVQTVFTQTPLSAEQMREALSALQQSKIKGVVLLVAQCGALTGTGNDSAMRDVADRSMNVFSSRERYLQVIHIEAVIALLRYYIAQRDGSAIRDAGWLVVTAAAKREDRSGLMALSAIHKEMQENPVLNEIAFEMVRQFVREADPQIARRAIRHFGRDAGEDKLNKLELSYIFGRMMNGLDFATYAASVNIAANMLEETTESYIDGSKQPSVSELMDVVNRIRTGLTGAARADMARDLRSTARAIVLLAEENQAKSSRSTKVLNAIIRGEEAPRNIVDVFRALGGYLSRGRLYRVKLTPYEGSDPFRKTPPEDLHINITVTNDVLSAALQALPPSQTIAWTVEDWRDEIDSVRRTLPREEAAEILQRLAEDWQRLAELIVKIARDSDTSAVEDDSRLAARIDSNNYQPRSPLELYRFIYAQFLS